MPRIFLPLPEIEAGLVSVTGEDARYLATVLRCRAGDQITVGDSRSRVYSGSIVRATKREVTIEITGTGRAADTESPLGITLLQGLLKGDRMDLVIQKATELGVSEIVPVITERSQVRETRKRARWQKIAQEASRQSGRSHIPAVRDPVDIESVFSERPVSGGGIMFWEEGGEKLSSVVGQLQGQGMIELFTGPEGGFSEEEVRAARGKGFAVATLGRRILRAETAAIVALGIVQYRLGDLGD
jgi:16S rRNA (uracil1498-N3)-methyltransferase